MVDSLTDKRELLVVPREKKKKKTFFVKFAISFLLERFCSSKQTAAWLQESIYRIYASKDIVA